MKYTRVEVEKGRKRYLTIFPKIGLFELRDLFISFASLRDSKRGTQKENYDRSAKMIHFFAEI